MAKVLDDREHNRFLFAHHGEDAELVYGINGNRFGPHTHTEVPEFFRGQGLGARLVQAAVDRASRPGETLVLVCPYARKWLQDHTHVAAAATIDWAEP